jgi:hypothetical protein
MIKALAATAALLVLTAGVARASTFITEAPPATDGSITWTLGDTGGIPAGNFTDDFSITLPAPGGITDGSVTATFTSPSTDLTFTSVTLGGDAFTLFNFPGEHGADLSPTNFSAGLLALEVNGVSPGIDGSYAGTLTFTPLSVPEPATWALMITGFGAAGVMLRRRRWVRATA